MVHVVPMAGGKGGVGKTALVVNAGVALARQGKTVVLVDLDMGASNLHTLLGLKNRHEGVGHFILGHTNDLGSLVVETAIPRLYAILGDVLLPTTANLPYYRKARILRELPNLVADYVLLDLGAGTAFNTIDFFNASDEGIVVTSPEITSILNAYAFVKNALYRRLIRSFPRNSGRRERIHTYMTQRLEGTDQTVAQLGDEFGPADAAILEEMMRGFRPRVVVNSVTEDRDIASAARLRQASVRNLAIDVRFLAAIPHDPVVGRSVAARTPAVEMEPESAFAAAVGRLARRLRGDVSIPPEDADIATLREEYRTDVR